ncbi:MAG: hypothetical protein HYT76_00820 [Deltaproteobacteria bacterium]|nr:hypothetical protein [Deltaproteobacteria bacterium]
MKKIHSLLLLIFLVSTGCLSLDDFKKSSSKDETGPSDNLSSLFTGPQQSGFTTGGSANVVVKICDDGSCTITEGASVYVGFFEDCFAGGPTVAVEATAQEDGSAVYEGDVAPGRYVVGAFEDTDLSGDNLATGPGPGDRIGFANFDPENFEGGCDDLPRVEVVEGETTEASISFNISSKHSARRHESIRRSGPGSVTLAIGESPDPLEYDAILLVGVVSKLDRYEVEPTIMKTLYFEEGESISGETVTIEGLERNKHYYAFAILHKDLRGRTPLRGIPPLYWGMLGGIDSPIEIEVAKEEPDQDWTSKPIDLEEFAPDPDRYAAPYTSNGRKELQAKVCVGEEFEEEEITEDSHLFACVWENSKGPKSNEPPVSCIEPVHLVEEVPDFVEECAVVTFSNLPEGDYYLYAGLDLDGDFNFKSGVDYEGSYEKKIEVTKKTKKIDLTETPILLEKL